MTIVPADVVYLKDGRAVEGKIIERTSAYLKIKLKVVEAKYEAKDISRVEIAELPKGFFKEDRTPKKATTALRAEGYSKPEASLYGMNLEARYETLKGKGIVTVAGGADLPDNALIYVILKRLGNTITCKQVFLKDRRFCVSTEPFDKKFLAGEYTVEAEFDPRRVMSKKTRRLKNARASCSLSIGTPEEMLSDEKRIMADINSNILKLEKLYGDLNEAYEENRKSYDPKTWKKWEESWLPREKALEKAVQNNFNLYVVYLFPESQKNIWNCVQYLGLLHRAYSLELADPENFSKRINDPENYIPEPGSLRDSFTRLLTSAQEDIAYAIEE